jgi:hypothetical protein
MTNLDGNVKHSVEELILKWGDPLAKIAAIRDKAQQRLERAEARGDTAGTRELRCLVAKAEGALIRCAPRAAFGSHDQPRRHLRLVEGATPDAMPAACEVPAL